MPRRTAAQQLALEVLQLEGIAFVSNRTSVPGALVYWQTGRWLVGRGYAEYAGWENGQEKLLITEAGRLA
jgi:hypothetical protein